MAFVSILNQLDSTRQQVAYQRQNNLNSIASLVSTLQTTKSKLDEIVCQLGDEDHNAQVTCAVQVNQTVKKGQEVLKKLVKENKDYYTHLSSFGKALSKEFQSDDQPELFETVALDTASLNKVIAEHLFRSGSYSTGELFCKESMTQLPDEYKLRFLEQNEIIADIAVHKIDKALAFAQQYSVELSEIGSDLLFLCHRAQFCTLLKAYLVSGLSQEAETVLIGYGRTHISGFIGTHRGQVLHLAGAIAGGECYEDLVSESVFQGLEEIFVKDFCRLKNMSQESALFQITKAGHLAVPQLTKMMGVLREANWKEHKELPAEINLGSEFRNHNTFICPVTKELSHGDNIPVALLCGHVVSKHAVQRMTRNLSRGGKFKCPTCPSEMFPSQVTEILNLITK